MCYAQAAAWVISAAITAYAGYQQAESQKDIAQYQADVANKNAELDDLRASQVATIGAIQEDQHRAKVRQMAGTQRANFAANGIDLGSGVVEEIIDQTYTFGETDALTIRFNAMNEAWGYRTQATNSRNDARFAKYRGNTEARNTYLTTAASIAGSSYQGYQSGVFSGNNTGGVNSKVKKPGGYG